MGVTAELDPKIKYDRSTTNENHRQRQTLAMFVLVDVPIGPMRVDLSRPGMYGVQIT